MNYLRSELYGLSRTKSFFMVGLVWIIGFILMTKLFLNGPVDSNPRQNYFEGMIISEAMSGFFLSLIISNLLTGKKLATLKQTISFGISKNTIYIVKFILALAVFSLLFGSITIAGILFGNLYLTGNSQQQIIKIINVLPLLVSSLALCNWLNFSQVNSVLSTVIILGTYFMSSDIIYLFDKAVFNRMFFANYFPSNLFLKAINSTHFEPVAFFVGLGLTALFLVLGLRSFNRRDIA